MIRRIPFDPKLIPYVKSIFNSDIIEYNHRSRHSVIIFGMLRRKQPEEKIYKPHQDYLLIQIPKSMYTKQLTYLGESSLKALETFFWDEMRDKFYTEVEKHVIAKMKMKDAILSLREKFQVTEEHLPYDTIQKAVYRRFKNT